MRGLNPLIFGSLLANSPGTSRFLKLSCVRMGDDDGAELAEAVRLNKYVCAVDVRYCALASLSANAWAETLLANHHITRLLIGGNNIGDAGAVGIARVLRTNNTLRELDVSSNNITFEGVMELSSMLSCNSTLQALDLRNNRVAEAARELAIALESNSSLSLLDIRGCQIDAQGAREIAVSLVFNWSLQTLFLSWNQIGDAGIKEIATSLRHNSSLLFIDLAGNKITNEGAKALDRVLQKENRAVAWVSDYASNKESPIDQLHDRLEPRRRVYHRNRALGMKGVVSLILKSLRPKKSVKSLRELDLSYIGMKVLPEEICQLVGLEKLCLYDNQLSSLPSGITALAKLRVLILTRNELVMLPRLPRMIEYLDISDNQLTMLPPEIGDFANLRTLLAWRNRLSFLASQLCYLSNLYTLDLTNNPISSIPDYILPPSRMLMVGPSALEPLFAYLRGVGDGGPVKYRRIKLMFVGGPSVGKSTLVEHLSRRRPGGALKSTPSTGTAQGSTLSGPNVPLGPVHTHNNAGNPFQEMDADMVDEEEDEDPTDAPPIQPLSLSPSGGEQSSDPQQQQQQLEATTQDNNAHRGGIRITDFKANKVHFDCWDFAGKETFYPLHQFFLASQAIYVVVFDISNQQTSKIEQWLQMIEVRTVDAPVVLVGTHSDHRLCTKEYVERFVNRLRAKLVRRFKSLTDIAVVSCKTGNTVNKLKKLLTKLAMAQKHAMKDIPKAWYHLEKQITRVRKSKQQPFMYWSDFEKVMTSVNVTDGAAAADFLHNIGVILTFGSNHDTSQQQERERGRNTGSTIVILDPLFLIDAMACLVVYNRLLVRNKGMLWLKHISVVFASFQKDFHPILLKLLSRFGLLFILPRQSPLIQAETGALGISASSSPVEGDDEDGQVALVPAMLPEKRPGNFNLVWQVLYYSAGAGAGDSSSTTTGTSKSTVDYENPVRYRRWYRFQFAPAGFFSQLMVRVLRLPVDAVCAWKHGLVVRLRMTGQDEHEDAQMAFLEMDPIAHHLQVEVVTGRHNIRHGGALFALLRETIDRLIAAWIINFECGGIRVVVPCLQCVARNSTLVERRVYDGHVFSMEECALAAMLGNGTVTCPRRHPSGTTIRVDMLAPDVLFDLSALRIDRTLLRLGRRPLGSPNDPISRGIGVYVGRYKDDRVAVKTLPVTTPPIPGSSSNAGGLSGGEPAVAKKPEQAGWMEWFEKEAYMMSKMKHPNIVQVKGVCLDPPMIVSEYVPLGNLYDFFERERSSKGGEGEVSWHVRTAIALDIARAMQHMHSISPPFVHGQLTGHNCLVSSFTEGSVGIKVDFSLSHRNHQGFGNDLLSWSGGRNPESDASASASSGGGGSGSSVGSVAQLGESNSERASRRRKKKGESRVEVQKAKKEKDAQRPYWIAPEVLASRCCVTVKVDVYGFAFLLYELLTLHPPVYATAPVRDVNDEQEVADDESPAPVRHTRTSSAPIEVASQSQVGASKSAPVAAAAGAGGSRSGLRDSAVEGRARSRTEKFFRDVSEGLRPPLPKHAAYLGDMVEEGEDDEVFLGLISVIEACWQHHPMDRPSFDEIVMELEQLRNKALGISSRARPHVRVVSNNGGGGGGGGGGGDTVDTGDQPSLRSSMSNRSAISLRSSAALRSSLRMSPTPNASGGYSSLLNSSASDLEDMPGGGLRASIINMKRTGRTSDERRRSNSNSNIKSNTQLRQSHRRSDSSSDRESDVSSPYYTSTWADDAPPLGGNVEVSAVAKKSGSGDSLVGGGGSGGTGDGGGGGGGVGGADTNLAYSKRRPSADNKSKATNVLNDEQHHRSTSASLIRSYESKPKPTSDSNVPSLSSPADPMPVGMHSAPPSTTSINADHRYLRNQSARKPRSPSKPWVSSPTSLQLGSVVSSSSRHGTAHSANPNDSPQSSPSRQRSNSSGAVSGEIKSSKDGNSTLRRTFHGRESSDDAVVSPVASPPPSTPTSPHQPMSSRSMPNMMQDGTIDQKQEQDSPAPQSIENLVRQLEEKHEELPEDDSHPTDEYAFAARMQDHAKADTLAQCMLTVIPGKEVWSGCFDGTIGVWDVKARKISHSMQAHTGRVNSLVVVGSTVWSAGDDKQVRIWRAKKRNLFTELLCTGPVLCLFAFEDRVYGGTANGALFVWETEELLLEGEIELRRPITSMFVDDSHIWLGTDGHIFVLNRHNLETLFSWEAHQRPIKAMVAVNDFVWTCSDDQCICVWSKKATDSVRATAMLKGHSGRVFCLMGGLGHEVWSGSFDKTVIRWDSSNYHILQELVGVHTDSVRAMAYVSDGMVWTAGLDGTLVVWKRVKEKKRKRRLGRLTTY
eukprot:TRINITY_DN300_c0_g1_i1.p1 TRINITY_DN300_c0_g1~~TRINITY_DN300_c0_g1_i1.p1  ORF type:complete len:2319 (-),score=629.17 TRINITY_DN300_c0_g1_i1:43-6999(-)